MAEDSILRRIASVAPTLGAALGGPFGGLAGTVVAKVLDVPVESVPGALATAQDVDLKKAEDVLLIRLRELGIQSEVLHQQDRESAREREKVVGGYAVPSIATLILAGFFGMVFMIITGNFITSGMDSAVIGLLNVVFGAVSTLAVQVVSYYFGSSTGQDDLNRRLHR